MPELTEDETKLIEDLVAYFRAERRLVSGFLNQVRGHLEESEELNLHLHSMRWRLKEEKSLRKKLERQIERANKNSEKFDVSAENLFSRINDLAGIRILHLHTRQIEYIDKALKQIFHEQNFELVEPPFARTWDNENRDYFRGLGFVTQESETLYTSVHYIVSSHSRVPVTCELQVRTLMEEVWGEVDHKINYPDASEVLAVREQIRALARSTSAATRLVDSIFSTYEDTKPPKE